MILYGLDKHDRHGDTLLSLSSGKSLFLFDWVTTWYLCSSVLLEVFCVSLHRSVFFSFVTHELLSARKWSHPPVSSLHICRSIWTCVPQQSSIPPASPTLAAPAPPVTTQCFPMTPYRMSPASPSTSTLTETWKHEPRSHPLHPSSTCPGLTPQRTQNTRSTGILCEILSPLHQLPVDWWTQTGLGW